MPVMQLSSAKNNSITGTQNMHGHRYEYYTVYIVTPFMETFLVKYTEVDIIYFYSTLECVMIVVLPYTLTCKS